MKILLVVIICVKVLEWFERKSIAQYLKYFEKMTVLIKLLPSGVGTARAEARNPKSTRRVNMFLR
jgi:hypothetical protein